MKAVFLDAGSFPERVSINLPTGVTEWTTYNITYPDECLARCQHADIILTNKVVLTAETIEQLTQTKLICITATGTNNVDLTACKDQGIQVVNATNYGTHSVAEHVLMLMLALARQLPVYLQANTHKAWADSLHFCDFQAPVKQLHGRILTVLGAGTLGTAVADLGRAFGMDVLYAERPEATIVRDGYTDFKTALTQADVISIHCPLSEQTYNLFNSQTLALCKTDAILINASRGGIVNESDLLKAIQNKKLGGAALDVTETEPPAKNAVLWALNEQPNVIITPHIAWAADEAMQNLMNQIMAKIRQFIESGQIDNLCQRP